MRPPVAAPPNAPTPAPFSRVLKGPPAQPVSRSAPAKTVIPVLCTIILLANISSSHSFHLKLDVKTYLLCPLAFHSSVSHRLFDCLCCAVCDARRRAPNPSPDQRTTANWY